MATKSFKSMLSKNQEEKKSVNLESENQILREKINTLKKQNGNVVENISSIKLSQIKLRDNIRDFYEFEELHELAEDIKQNGQLQSILLTKDDYLIAGFRRYFAMKSIDKDFEVIVSRLDKNSSEINDNELKNLQYAENNQRRNIDNFQLSNLFNWYLENGLSQKDLSDKFKKNKGTVSAIIALRNLDEYMINLVKEFQLYGVSKEKFGMPNFDQKQQELFLEKKGNIGYKTLYTVVKQDSLVEQKRAFLKNFKNRLSDNELNSPYFSDVPVEEKNKNLAKEGLKYLDSLKKLFDNQDTDFIQSEEYTSFIKDIEKLEKKLSKIKF